MAETPCFREVQVFSGKRIRVRENFLTALSPRNYLASPREITPEFTCIYSPIPERLLPYSILFIYGVPSIYIGSCIIDILEKLNYHHDETNLSSR